jgi:hypothetical protein
MKSGDHSTNIEDLMWITVRNIKMRKLKLFCTNFADILHIKCDGIETLECRFDRHTLPQDYIFLINRCVKLRDFTLEGSDIQKNQAIMCMINLSILTNLTALDLTDGMTLNAFGRVKNACKNLKTFSLSIYEEGNEIQSFVHDILENNVQLVRWHVMFYNGEDVFSGTKALELINLIKLPIAPKRSFGFGQMSPEIKDTSFSFSLDRSIRQDLFQNEHDEARIMIRHSSQIPANFNFLAKFHCLVSLHFDDVYLSDPIFVLLRQTSNQSIKFWWISKCGGSWTYQGLANLISNCNQMRVITVDRCTIMKEKCYRSVFGIYLKAVTHLTICTTSGLSKITENQIRNANPDMKLSIEKK